MSRNLQVISDRPRVDEINMDPDIVVKKLICDMIERHHVKGLKGCCGHNSCQICAAHGIGPRGGSDLDSPRTTRYSERPYQRWSTAARSITANCVDTPNW